MSTAALCGMSGSVTGATGALEIFSWEIVQTIDAIEATSFDSAGWKERIACLKGASGSFKSQGASSTVGKHVSAVFKDAQVGEYTISGNIVISKITIETPVADKITFNHEFNFTGTIVAG